MPASLLDDPVLRRFSAAVRSAHGERLERIVLFGSRARGDHKPDSDYDIAVFVRDMGGLLEEIRRLRDIIAKFSTRPTRKSPRSRALRPGSLTGWCSRHGFKLHGARHLNASLLITSQPLPIVAQRLGHSRPDVTLRTYSHILPNQDQAAAEAIDAAIG